MSEFPSEEDDRESRGISERAAEYRALPLRAVVALANEGEMAVLDCGHWRALHVSLRVGDTVRCRECYTAGLQVAQRMVERMTDP